MKIPDPVIIGYPDKGEPRQLGLLSGHGLDREFIPGEELTISRPEGSVTFMVNVSYIPSNPKWERVIAILEPRGEISDAVWRSRGFEREAAGVSDTKEEEWPF